MKCLGLVIGALILVFCGGLAYLSFETPPTKRTYGVTFSGEYAREIGIDWQAAYLAVLDELGVRAVRIPAYWDLIERSPGAYDWSELDFYVHEARERGAQVTIALGRRVPRWPECHIPSWAGTLPWEQQKAELRELIRAVIERYRSEPNIAMWQVENEVFLPVFADESCGTIVDEAFLEEEIALVKLLDARPILITDSGNLGFWYKPYQLGDVFGTSMYLYFWRADTGLFRTILPSSLYATKLNLMRLVFGEKPAILSELSLEPWLGDQIANVSIEEQRARMSVEKMHEIIAYAAESPFSVQYLWGAEWWYYMRERDYPEYWAAMKVLYRD
jgi:hypothetical protein